MRKLRVAVVSSALCWFLLLSLFGCTKPAQSISRSVQDSPVPDRRGRSLAEKMQKNPVEEVTFIGVHFMRFEDDPIRITDQKQIARLQKALEVAQTRREEILNRGDVMQVFYKQVHGKRPPADFVNINIESPIDCFGTEFHTLVAEIRKNSTGSKASSLPE